MPGCKWQPYACRGRSNEPDLDAFVNAFAGSNRQIMDYLSEEVYRRQPAEVCRFLLRTSILDHFNASLCSNIMGGDTLLTGDVPPVDVAQPAGTVAEAQISCSNASSTPTCFGAA